MKTTSLKSLRRQVCIPLRELTRVDWPDADTIVPGTQSNGSATAGAASVALDMSGSARLGGEHLWEDNWDDDDIEDDFSNALRYV